jgi:hypothetical protein
MIAWVAVRNDPGGYGKTTVFRFPSQSSVFGPAQVEAQIDIDPEISAQITLWNQSGSTVIRGNLIVLPVGNSLIYLQPVYLQSNSSKFPAFERNRRRILEPRRLGRDPRRRAEQVPGGAGRRWRARPVAVADPPTVADPERFAQPGWLARPDPVG